MAVCVESCGIKQISDRCVCSAGAKSTTRTSDLRSSVSNGNVVAIWCVALIHWIVTNWCRRACVQERLTTQPAHPISSLLARTACEHAPDSALPSTTGTPTNGRTIRRPAAYGRYFRLAQTAQSQTRSVQRSSSAPRARAHARTQSSSECAARNRTRTQPRDSAYTVCRRPKGTERPANATDRTNAPN